MLTIKKIGKKDFHLGNRLNGNGANNRARYAVFNGTEMVARITYNGTLYDVYLLDNKTRMFDHAFSKLSEIKAKLKIA